MKEGILKLKTGLTASEIDDMMKELKFDSDGTISFKDFSDEVVNGAKVLQSQKVEKANKFKVYMSKL